jgi:hypothetical protein
MRRGQAAMEYIVTYGWAFLVILVAIGALAYFGVINPSKWVADRCDLGTQLECVDYQVDSAGTLNLYLRNNFGKDINISEAVVRKDDGSLSNPSGFVPAGILAGQTGQITIPNLDGYFKKGEKQQVIVQVQFYKTGPPAGSAHNLTGVIYAMAK